MYTFICECVYLDFDHYRVKENRDEKRKHFIDLQYTLHLQNSSIYARKLISETGIEIVKREHLISIYTSVRVYV